MRGWSAHPQGGHPEHISRAGGGYNASNVMPTDDEPMHWNRTDCWCGPALVKAEPVNRWEHRASDGTGPTR